MTASRHSSQPYWGRKHCWPCLDWIYRNAGSDHWKTWWIIVMATSAPSLSCLNGNTFELEGGNLAAWGWAGKWCVWGVNKTVSRLHFVLTSCRSGGVLHLTAAALTARQHYWSSFIMCIHQQPLKAIITYGQAGYRHAGMSGASDCSCCLMVQTWSHTRTSADLLLCDAVTHRVNPNITPIRIRTPWNWLDLQYKCLWCLSLHFNMFNISVLMHLMFWFQIPGSDPNKQY